MTDTVSQPLTASRPLPWYGWAGAITLLLGEVALFLDILVFDILAVRVFFYGIAWWSYIFLVDAWVWKRRGFSLVRNRPWEFWFLAFWSIALWNLFELFNFRLQNWCYINVPSLKFLAVLFNYISFATVLPGIFETYDLLSTFQLFVRTRIQPWRVSPAVLWGSVASGLGMLAAALLWPQSAFPLTWGFAVFLGDPVCYWLGARTTSLLGQFERGDPRPFLRLLLAGVVCGGLWEFWNFWAYTKWLYTVPYLEELKWFEMPPLGFVGFPPFAVECYVLVNLLNAVRRGRGWETPTPPGTGVPRRVALALVAASMAFNALVYVGIDRNTVKSEAPQLSDLEGVSAEIAERLARSGVTTPPTLLRRTATSGQLDTLSRESRIARDDLQRVVDAARLADLKGLGAANRNALHRLGIQRVEDLARQEPLALLPFWQAAVQERPPTLPQVSLWIRAARRAGGGAHGSVTSRDIRPIN
jgi:predicted flap endonuclease-1-like 5' DNA nuclease